jgi:hypothetical protein
LKSSNVYPLGGQPNGQWPRVATSQKNVVLEIFQELMRKKSFNFNHKVAQFLSFPDT